MNEEVSLAYVQASAALLDLPLDAAQAARVAAYLARTADMARMLDEAPLDVADEPVALYCPATFPESLP
ncbi:MAG TPA: AtzG-like protein [Bordetella sp.]|nr:AtzG-like protein [Bordetella sp.]